MAAPYSPSLTPLECVYIALSSAGVKMQDGRKGRRKGKKKDKTTKNTELNKKEKKDVGWDKQDSRGCGEWCPTG